MSDNITIRKFEKKDINNKIRWINDSKNNKYLHYDLPLEYDRTLKWFEKNFNNKNRFDAVIEFNNMPVGLIGLLDIDEKNLKAEYYVVVGEINLKGKGIATEATRLLLEYAFNKLNLNKIYLFTEEENLIAQKCFERVGFKKEGLLKEDLFYNNKKVNRYIYGICKGDYKVE